MAFTATIAMETAVTISGGISGCVISSSGTRRNPPPAPIKVPNVPIRNPTTINTIKLSIPTQHFLNNGK
jgi:hypothetical protein